MCGGAVIGFPARPPGMHWRAGARLGLSVLIAIAVLVAGVAPTPAARGGRGVLGPPSGPPGPPLKATSLSRVPPLAGSPPAISPPVSAQDRYLGNWSSASRVASDPSDPQQLLLLETDLLFNVSSEPAGSGAAVLAASSDGGTTWSAETVPPAANWSTPDSPACGQRFTGDGDVAFSANGTEYFAGTTSAWPGLTTCEVPQWGDGIYLSWKAPGTEAWSVPVPVSGQASGAVASDPALVVNPEDGAALVAYSASLAGVPTLELTNVSDGQVEATTTVWVGPVSSVSMVAPPDAPGSVELLWESAGALETSYSVDGGIMFAPVEAIADGLATPSVYPPSIVGAQTALVADPSAGRVFAVWVNGTTSPSPAGSVLLASAQSDSSAWGATVDVYTLPGTAFFQPSATLDGTGTLALTWLSENLSGERYQPLGAFLRPPGPSTTEGLPFPLASSGSPVDFLWNGTTAATQRIGNQTSVVTTGSGVMAAWTDLRSTEARGCQGCAMDPVRNESVYANSFAPLYLSTDLPSVNVTLGGAAAGNGTVRLGSEAPAIRGFEVGSRLTVGAPPLVTENGTTWSFAAWVGSEFSGDPSFSAPWNGSANLTACYVPVAGEPCALPGSPGLLTVRSAESDGTGTINGTDFTLQNGSFTELLAPGSYTVELDAIGYLPSVEQVSVASGEARELWINLTGNARIQGTVAPSDASVWVDGEPVPVGSSGEFGLNVSPGVYNLTASAPSCSAYRLSAIAVGDGQTVSVSPSLNCTAQILGSVVPAAATVAYGPPFCPWGSPGDACYGQHYHGTNLTVNRSTGQFSGDAPALDGDLGAPFYLVAYLGGYNTTQLGPFAPTPGARLQANITLGVADGWISGVVLPPSAAVTVDGMATNVSPGCGSRDPTSPCAYPSSFNDTVPPGVYVVNITAAGFVPYSATVTVRPGLAEWMNVTLASTPASLMGPPLTEGSLLKGLSIDVVLLGGLAATFVVARRKRVSPSADGTAR